MGFSRLVLGCMVVKADAIPPGGARGMLDGLCDDICVIVDDSPGYWTIPEWKLRQRYVDEAIERKADWAFALDADEEVAGRETLLHCMRHAGDETALIRILRVDMFSPFRGRARNVWDGSPQFVPVAWRPKWGQIVSRKPIHCGRVPNSAVHEGRYEDIDPSMCCLVHYGYANAHNRAAKLARWKEIDPENRMFSCDYDSFFSGLYVERMPYASC